MIQQLIKITSNENITNGTTENIPAADSSTVHVNGENEEPMAEINNEVKPTEKSSQDEPIVSSTEPKPVSSTSVDTPMEVSTTTVDTTPPPAVEPTTTVSDTVPEVPVATESESAELKTKAPRGRAKPPVVTTTPTLQSARGRKPASSSTTNVEEIPTTDDTSVSNQTEPSTTSGVNVANDDDVSPTASKKRAAPTSATKKPKGKTSTPSVDEVDSGVAAVGINESETMETPPKKARTSANKKTPEPPSEEYVRKLRPRK